MSLAPGDRLGPYEIIAPLGAGGMGEVYRARDPRLQRDVAIKRLKAHHSARFEQEARAIAALNHPHICQIYDIGPDYLVMEFVDGKPLVSGGQPLRVEEAVKLALQIASALEEAHGRGVLHRDLKPANILVTEKGAKLLDFGLAKAMSGSEEAATQTLEGTILGTVAYMAPEQAEGQPVDARSDIFSFGAVLYEMLSGHQAFRGKSMAGVLSAVLRDDPAPVDAPAELQRVLARCLAKRPEERFRTMREVRTALEQAARQPREQQASIAVLPFANMSREADDEYFSDGLAEEILNLLAKTPGLKVTARTSSFAFRGKEQDIVQIAETLRVGTILEGSVRRAGNRIRVTAQLINATDGYHLWSERYDRELTDVFAVQDEIAAAIAKALKVTLTGAAPAERRHQPGLPAYEAFLKGRYQLLKNTPTGFERAKEYFEQAIQLDRRYAEPHAELAIYYVLQATQALRPAREMMVAARVAAQRALALDPSEPRAHTALCGVAASYDFDWKQAEEHFRKALAADAVPAEVRLRVALFYLVPLGRYADAISHFEAVLEQDPLNVLFRSAFCLALAVAGQCDRTLAEAQKACEVEEGLWMTHYAVSIAQESRGMFAQALEAAERAAGLAPWNPILPCMVAGLRIRLGRPSDLPVETPAAGMTTYHLLAGNLDAALDAFDRSIEERSPFTLLWAASTFLKPLRAHPRWPALARKMNLPEVE